MAMPISIDGREEAENRRSNAKGGWLAESVWERERQRYGWFVNNHWWVPTGPEIYWVPKLNVYLVGLDTIVDDILHDQITAVLGTSNCNIFLRQQNVSIEILPIPILILTL